MMKDGRQRMRWRLKWNRMTATSPSPNTAVTAVDVGLKSLPKVLLNQSFLLCSIPGSVFCVSLDPATNSMAVTGGEDDKAFVWRVSDGEVLLECTGEARKNSTKHLSPHWVFKAI